MINMENQQKILIQFKRVFVNVFMISYGCVYNDKV